MPGNNERGCHQAAPFYFMSIKKRVPVVAQYSCTVRLSCDDHTLQLVG